MSWNAFCVKASMCGHRMPKLLEMHPAKVSRCERKRRIFSCLLTSSWIFSLSDGHKKAPSKAPSVSLMRKQRFSLLQPRVLTDLCMFFTLWVNECVLTRGRIWQTTVYTSDSISPTAGRGFSLIRGATATWLPFLLLQMWNVKIRQPQRALITRRSLKWSEWGPERKCRKL